MPSDTMPDTLAAPIPADTLDDLRWQSEHPAAIVHMDKPTLRALLAAYERESSQVKRYECDCCGRKVTRDQIVNVIAYGIETAACDHCRGETGEGE